MLTLKLLVRGGLVFRPVGLLQFLHMLYPMSISNKSLQLPLTYKDLYLLFQIVTLLHVISVIMVVMSIFVL